MGRLDEITLEELYELKEEIDEGKPRERVPAAIGRKQGDQIDTLAERHGVVEKTIRNWLDRFEEEPIEQAPYDALRPGGPAKIRGEEREQLFEQLQQPPTELGYDQQAWSAKLLLHHVKEEYGVEYHENYAYELLREAGLSLRTARPQHHEADPEEKAEFQETVEKKKRPELSEKTVVAVDQFTKHVGTVQRRGWYPIGSNPTIETATSWESVTVLGAVTDDGDSFYCWTEENLTRFHGIRLLEALKDKFGEELVVFLDRAGYFYARDLWEHVSGERETETVGDSSVSCVRGDDLEVWYFPSKLPELNAVEGCWDQLQEWFKYRLMPDLSTLKDYIPRGLSAITEPNIWPYLTGKNSS